MIKRVGFGCCASLLVFTSCGGSTESQTNATGGTGALTGSGGAGSVDPTSPGTQPPPDPGGSPTIGAQITQLAFERMFLGDTNRKGTLDSNAWRAYGYNLDGILSSKTGGDHCKLAPGAAPDVKEDGDGGVDNSFGLNVIPLLSTLKFSPTDEMNAIIASGDFTSLIRINGLQGMPNQTQLPGAFMTGAALGKTPAFNGTDVWPAAAESYVSGQPKVLFPKSYVANGTWVSGAGASLAVAIGFGGSYLPLEIHHGFITMQVSGTGTQASGKNGVLAGVIDTEAFLKEVVKAFGSIANLCSGPTVDGALQKIRVASDIMLDGTNGDPSKACNGISVGFGFEAVAVVPGGIAPPAPATPDPCAK